MTTSLLRLLQISSPTLPIGAYAYSQGLESAVHYKAVHDQDSALEWLQLCLLEGLADNELALIHHAYQAWSEDDYATLQHLSALSKALRETAELKQEDAHLAKALLRLSTPLQVPFPDVFNRPLSYSVVFARFCQYWDIPVTEALTAFAWSWSENQIAAMIKLVPLGQTQGQILMLEMDKDIQNAVKKAADLALDDIGNSLPNLAILSSLHENQYSRLFRS